MKKCHHLGARVRPMIVQKSVIARGVPETAVRLLPLEQPRVTARAEISVREAELRCLAKSCCKDGGVVVHLRPRPTSRTAIEGARSAGVDATLEEFSQPRHQSACRLPWLERSRPRQFEKLKGIVLKTEVVLPLPFVR